MKGEESRIELLAKLADETLRANALAAELESVRASASWRAMEYLRLHGRAAQKLSQIFRSIAIFILRLTPGYGLRKTVNPETLLLLRKKLEDSRLFDAQWYAKQYPDIRDDPAAHFLQTGHLANHDPGPLFQTEWYKKCNPDIAGANPLLHFLETGAGEGRQGWSMQRVLEVQRPFFKDVNRALAVLEQAERNIKFPTLSKQETIHVYASSRGNIFFRHIRDLLCRGLQQSGLTAQACDEHQTGDGDKIRTIIVAPHEFFYLGRGQKLKSGQNHRRAICVNTEQIQTPWFARAYPYLAQAEGVLDFNIQNAATLAQMGMPCRYLSPGFVAGDPVLGLQDILPDEPATRSFGPDILAPPPAREAPLKSRPIDLLFVGGLTPRRERFFARAASRLADKACVIHLTDMTRPVRDGGGIGMAPELFAGLSQRAKIQLNIHQGVLPYFEWHRMIMFGFWHRTAVVTETGFRTPDYVPGEDYFEEQLDKIPELLEWLLRSQDGAEKCEEVATRAFEKLRSGISMAQNIKKLLNV